MGIQLIIMRFDFEENERGEDEDDLYDSVKVMAYTHAENDEFSDEEIHTPHLTRRHLNSWSHLFTSKNLRYRMQDELTEL